MYKKLLKKYYLNKIFTICLPIKKFCNPTYYTMCNYLIKTTPFFNIKILLEEFYKLIYLFHLQFNKNYLLFFCSEKIFFLKSNFLIFKKVTYMDWKFLNNTIFFNWEKKSMFVCLYNFLPTHKCITLIKDLKLLSIGFLNYETPFNFVDYIFPLESTTFSNIYFFHFTLKKLLNNVKN